MSHFKYCLKFLCFGSLGFIKLLIEIFMSVSLGWGLGLVRRRNVFFLAILLSVIVYLLTEQIGVRQVAGGRGGRGRSRLRELGKLKILTLDH